MRICFWGYIADALRGKTGGGGELQIAMLAKTLARSGHEVVVVDLDIAEKFVTDDGIEVYPVKGYNNGIKMLRTFTHRLPGLYSELKSLNADVYYCRIREYRHIIVYWAARKVKARFILGLASDLDILDIRTRYRHFYSSNVKDLWGIFNGFSSELVYPFLLRKADCVLVQHRGQKELLESKGIASVVFPNVIDTSGITPVSNPERNYYVYVGSLDKRKGFKDFFRVVQLSPLLSFKVIGSPRDKTGDQYNEKLRSFKNVELTGRLSHEETVRQISSSRALISTSPMEGFPNIFLEAWACGIPVLSLYVDPGGVIERERLGGVFHGNIDSLLSALNNPVSSDGFMERARSYVERSHALNPERIRMINDLFINICSERK